jgi:uncharacterized protein DUF4249
LRKTTRPALAAAALAALAACTIADVTTVPGEETVVVEAVLRADRVVQQILLHRALNGRFSGPVPGAEVTVTDAAGTVYRFVQDDGDGCYHIDPRYQASDSLDFHGTCYRGTTGTPQLRRWVVPGGTYDLHVRLPDGGGEIRGRTTVPGDFRLRVPRDTVPTGGVLACSLPPDTRLPLQWTRAAGAWSYSSRLRIRGLRRVLEPRGINAPDPLDLRGFALGEEDTTLLLPTEFGVFERFQYDQDVLLAIQEGLPDGTTAEVVLAAGDRNWLNSVRGGSFNPSGQVRISTVVGDGVGVFASLVPRSVLIEVSETSTLRRCMG